MKFKTSATFLVLFFSINIAFCGAQTSTDSTNARLINGISFKQDSILLVNFHFRIQSRFGFISQNLQNVFPGNFDLGIRRARLFFDGHVY
jgi:hypothetical protein